MLPFLHAALQSSKAVLSLVTAAPLVARLALLRICTSCMASGEWQGVSKGGGGSQQRVMACWGEVRWYFTSQQMPVQVCYTNTMTSVGRSCAAAQACVSFSLC